MKKILLTLLIFAIFGGLAFAEFDPLSYPPPVKGGNILADAGLGFRSTGYSSAKWKIPPIFIQAEYALPVGVPISVGGMFTICSYGYDYNWGRKYSWKWTDMTFAARGNWHWGFDIDWLDLYTGIAIGYLYSKWDSDGIGSGWDYDYSGVFFAFQGGAHFYFTDFIGAVVEVGYPYWIKAGVALKF